MSGLETGAIIAIVSAVTSAAATGYSIYAQNQAQNYQEALALRNAEIQNENAKRAVTAAQINQQDQDFRARQEIADYEATFGASGLSLASDTFIQNKRGLQTLARRDAENIRYEGELQKQNYLQSAAGATAEANNARNNKTGIAVGGALNIGSSLIGSASKFYSYKSSFAAGSKAGITAGKAI